MATKRMFSKLVCSTDDYFSLSLGAQALFVQLQLEADDFGFIANPKRIMRGCMREEHELQELIERGYLIEFFDTGHVVLRHWGVANKIDKRCKPLDEGEYSRLNICEDCRYILVSGNFAEVPGNSASAQASASARASAQASVLSLTSPLGRSFVRPTLEMVEAEIRRAGLQVEAARFLADCQADGWKDGKGEPIRDWKKYLRGYAALARAAALAGGNTRPPSMTCEERHYSGEDLNALIQSQRDALAAFEARLEEGG